MTDAQIKPKKGLVFLDMETTGLHDEAQAFEVAWLPDWESTSEIRRLVLPHTLHGADPEALAVNHYRERGIANEPVCTEQDLDHLRVELTGANLVIANPVFDERFLKALLGFPVWHYRFTEIESYAQAIFALPNPPGMSDIVARLNDMGYQIKENDHTAVGDVYTLVQAHAILTRLAVERKTQFLRAVA